MGVNQLEGILAEATAADRVRLLSQVSKHCTPLQFCLLPLYKAYLQPSDRYLHIFGNVLEYLDDGYVLQFLSAESIVNMHRLAWVVMLICKYHPAVGFAILCRKCKNLCETTVRDSHMTLSPCLYVLKAFELSSASGFSLDFEDFDACCVYIIENEHITANEAIFLVNYVEIALFDYAAPQNLAFIFAAMTQTGRCVTTEQKLRLIYGEYFPYGLRFCIATYGILDADVQTGVNALQQRDGERVLPVLRVLAAETAMIHWKFTR